MKIDFEKASFKDFENPVGMDAYERASYFNEFLDFLDGRGHLNYRLLGLTGCGPEVDLDIAGYGGRRSYVSLVSNDYLGFTQHPLVIPHTSTPVLPLTCIRLYRVKLSLIFNNINICTINIRPLEGLL